MKSEKQEWPREYQWALDKDAEVIDGSGCEEGKSIYRKTLVTTLGLCYDVVYGLTALYQDEIPGYDRRSKTFDSLTAGRNFLVEAIHRCIRDHLPRWQGECNLSADIEELLKKPSVEHRRRALEVYRLALTLLEQYPEPERTTEDDSLKMRVVERPGLVPFRVLRVETRSAHGKLQFDLPFDEVLDLVKPFILRENPRFGVEITKEEAEQIISILKRGEKPGSSQV